MRILVLSASMNDPSNSDLLADAFARGVKKEPGAEVGKIRLKGLQIAHFELKHYQSDAVDEPDFARVKQAVLEADGVVIATPIWNFSVPAQLKNLIDRMGAFGLDPQTRSVGTLEGKPFFYIVTAGGGTASWHGLMRATTSHLQVGLQYFGTTTIATHFEPKCTEGKGGFMLVVDKRPECLPAMEKKGAEFAKVVSEYKQTGKLPLKASANYALFNVGQKILRAFGITP